eukprot:scaffold51393_cov17-Tisochrysis_lutea.AAC.1
MFFASNDASPLLQAGIIIYRGLYFGLYDTIKPMLLTGAQWAGSEFWSCFSSAWVLRHTYLNTTLVRSLI